MPLVRLLVDASADVNSVDGYGRTALIRAVHANHTSAARLLLAAKAHTIEAFREGGDGLVWNAISNGNVPLLSTLVRAKADMHRTSSLGWAGVYLAANQGLTRALQVLLAAKVDADAPDSRGRTALWYAELKGHAAAAQLLRTPRP
jgi:ankyrin repeat protein